MSFRLDALAAAVGGEVHGDPATTVDGLAVLGDAGPSALSFLTDPRQRGAAEASRAGVLLVGKRLPDRERFGRPLLLADDPGLALNVLLRLFHPAPPRQPAGVHPTAVLGAGVELDPTASIGPYVVVGEGSRIGPGAALHPHVVVGRWCTLGAEVVLHPHVVLYDHSQLGDRVEVHAGTVLGSDGFGYVSRRGVHHKVPQVGRVVIEEDVEIGALTAVDRALLAETRIGAGTKVDNQVQLGHNVRVGRGALLCGQVGIAGSAEIGDGVVMGGRSGSAGHLTIGAGAAVAATSVALQSVAPGAQVAGVPAMPLSSWRRQVAALARLGEVFRRLRRIERALDLNDGTSATAKDEDGHVEG